MKIFKLLFVCVLGIAMTSCLGGDNTMSLTRSLQAGSCFNYIVDKTTGEGSVNATGATYTLNIDVTGQTVDINVSGLQLTPGGASYTFNINDQKFSYDATGAIVVNVPSTIDTGNNVTINNFRLSMLDRAMGQSWIPVWTISYVVDGRYQVSTVQMSTFYFGTSTVLTSGSDEPFEVTSPYYCIVFDNKTLTDGNKMKGKFYLFNAKFAPSMPNMNMSIRDIEFTFDEDGFSARAPKLDLYVDDNTLQPDYAISDFSLSATYRQSTFGENVYPCCNVRFVCAGRFNTSLELGYNIPKSQE